MAGKPKTEFALNQKIVYPSQGVGKITEIFKRDFQGQQVYYYKIYVEVSDMTVMVPVTKATELGIRSIVSASQAQKALNMIGEEFEPPTSDWKLRYQMNLDLLKKGTIQDIASIVRCLYHRSKVKELPILERKLYDSAKKLLEDEIAEAMGKPVKEVEALLHAKLEPLGARAEKKNLLVDDDDDEDDEFGDLDEDKNSRGRDDDDDDDGDLDDEDDE
ncbi:MAG TPA: CarD family transcriptional regulator [Treponema sp.]|jgi:CarD family transcriptional regulator|nr:CarD family transcriptional regulator [Treponema sp.]HBD67757.1 CarD family transcriptional regulator [Treponema sp.]